jgi:polyphosphate glucokinase
MKKDTVVLGVDVGASGFKGGLVDIKTGTMVTERFRFDTPQPATPAAMAYTFRQLIDHFDYRGVVGVGFPAVVQRNVARSASNIDKGWIGTSISETFGKNRDVSIYALNDADAAGIATMHFGTGRSHKEDGTVVMITIGTGLGGAMFLDGELVPNFELGQIYLKGMDIVAEKYVSNRVRKDSNMDWKTFGKRLNKYLKHIDFILNPDLIVLGGGGSKHFPEYKKYLNCGCEIKPAEMRNTAGTVGAAMYGYRRHHRKVAAV